MTLHSSYAARAMPPGSAAYFQILFTAPEHRAALSALFALRAEIGRAIAHPGDESVAGIRLGWWREEISRLCQGSSRHPVTQELARASPSLAGEFACLNRMLDAAARDLQRTTYKDIETLAGYARDSTAPVYRLAALLPRSGDSQQRRVRLEAADALGCGVRLTEIVASVGRDAIDERIYLPIERLDHDEARALLEGVVSPEIERALHVTHAAARSRLAAAQAAFRTIRCDRASAVALEWHTMLLAAVEKRGFQVTQRPTDLHTLQKVYISWRAAGKPRAVP